MDNQEKIVYHYMSVQTFLKILEKSLEDNNLTFHASDIFSMNDPTEFKYGFEKVWELLPKIEEKEGVLPVFRISNLWRGERKETEIECNNKIIDEMHNEFSSPFVICFSKKSDFLPMWSTYGNNGEGLSVGLDIKDYYLVAKREEIGKSYKFYTGAVEVCYDDISMDNPIAQYIENVLYKRYLSQVTMTKLSELKKEYLKEIMSYASTLIKHPAYSYEEEYRLSKRVDTEQIKFKTNSKGKPIAYIEVKIPKNCIKHIVIGPRCDYDSVKLILDTKMKQLGLDELHFSKSGIPYR